MSHFDPFGVRSLPPASRREVEDAQTEKPLDAKRMLEELAKTARDASYAMVEAIAYLEEDPRHSALFTEKKLRESYDALKKVVDAATAAIGPRTHSLKADVTPFRLVWSGLKPFEVRKFDRDYRVGDVVRLMEHDRENGTYSGCWIKARITSMVRPGEYGMPDDTGVLGIEVFDKGESQ